MAAAIQHLVCAGALSVETTGVQWLAAEICEYCQADITQVRWLIAAFCQSAIVSCDQQVPVFFKHVPACLNDSNASAVEAELSVFGSLNTTLRPHELAKHIAFIRNNLNSIATTRVIARAMSAPRASLSCLRLRY